MEENIILIGNAFHEVLERVVPSDSLDSANLDQRLRGVLNVPHESGTSQDRQGTASTLKRKLEVGVEEADGAKMAKKSPIEETESAISFPAIRETATSSEAGQEPSVLTSSHHPDEGQVSEPSQAVTQHSSLDALTGSNMQETERSEAGRVPSVVTLRYRSDSEAVTQLSNRDARNERIMAQLIQVCGEVGRDKLPTVKSLIDSLHGSVNITGSYTFRTELKSPKSVTLEGVSPLFVAAAKCNLKVANLLLLKGAQVNFRTGFQKNSDYSGMTPLHALMFFSRKLEPSKRQPVMKLLLQHGADLFLSAAGSLWALETSSLVELTKLLAGTDSNVGLLDKIAAHELMGAMVLLRDDADSASRALQHWNDALLLRAQGSLPKVPLISTNSVPWRQIEWMNRDQLDDLQLRPRAEIKHQAILVAHRIFSNVSAQALFKCVWLRSLRPHCVVLIKQKRYRELMEVCWSILEGVRQLFSKSLPSNDDLALMIADVSGYLVNCLEKDDSLVTSEVLKLSAELIFDNISVTTPGDTLRTIYDLVLVLAQNLLMVTDEMKDYLRKYVERDDRDRYGYNLLLVTCDRQANDWTLPAIRLLLEVGSNPNARNRKGDSPLHLVPQWMNILAIDSPILDVLIENGASTSQLNHAGQTPLDLWREKYPVMRRNLPFPILTVNTVMSLFWWCVKKVRSDETVEGTLQDGIRACVLEQY